LSSTRYCFAAFVYALLIAYASTVVGPLGFHFVLIDPREALSRLLAITYVDNGSDQRSDWMGNVALLVPLGFLLAGWCSYARRLSVARGVTAFVLSVGFILAVKYAQLFFPPRTVTLNYVLAQTTGAIIGILLYGGSRQTLSRLGEGPGGLEGLRVVLWIYTALMVLFMLTPLDFALNMEDLIAQLDKLPDTFTTIAGAGRPFVVRVALILTSILITIPAGALFAIVSDGRTYVGRSIGAATSIGLGFMTGVYALTTLVISGAPSLPAIVFHTLGIAVGAAMMHVVVRQDPDKIRRDLAGLVPWMVPVYLLALLAVNGLLSLDWTTPDQAEAALRVRWFIPLFDYYIVSKAQAAKNIASHAVMYAPIGVMIWLRARYGGGTAVSFVLAALLSLAVEAARFLRPGLAPDINAVLLAGFAAWAAAALMPLLWRMLSAVAIAPPIVLQAGGLQPGMMGAVNGGRVPGWRDRAAERHARRANRGKVIGDIEEY
jgi:VanZ family protein